MSEVQMPDFLEKSGISASLAIAGFLDSECLNFADCKPEYS
jgi:hypothetical protein